MSPLPPSSTPPPPGLPSATIARTLDANALARLHELDPDGRHGVLRRILQAFDTSLSRMLGQLAAERTGGNAAVVTYVAHTLKSSAGSVGAVELAAACAAVEAHLRGTVDSAALQADIEQLHREGEAAIEAVRAMLRA
jgi:HPt (histidine-containing phosphotransfer) domain-containing protein